MEHFFDREPNELEKDEIKDHIEAEANFEGNDMIVLIERLSNPIIKNQMINVLFEQEQGRYHFYQKEIWEPYLPEGWTGEEEFSLLKGRHSEEIIDKQELEHMLQEEPATRQELEEDINRKIDSVLLSTNIDFTSNGPSVESIPLNWIVSTTGQKPTQKQQSIVEAHEKGHAIRNYDESTDKLMEGFDISCVQFTEEDRKILERAMESCTHVPLDLAINKTLSLSEIRDNHLLGYLFTGSEIAERMSQLKNYFGISGADAFTEDHLEYARKHYIEDTNLDNGMSHFFQAITEDTKHDFLRLINSFGI